MHDKHKDSSLLHRQGDQNAKRTEEKDPNPCDQMLSETSEHFVQRSCEPRHDKTNNVAVRPAKTQISLGTRKV